MRVHSLPNTHIHTQPTLPRSTKIIDDQDAFAKSIVGTVAGTAEAFCKFIPSDSRCTQLTATVSKWTKRIIDDAGRIAKDQIRCAGAVTKYAEGMACFACDVQFANFVDLEHKVLKIAETTCDHIYAECQQALESDVVALMNTISKFVAELLNDLTGAGIVRGVEKRKRRERNETGLRSFMCVCVCV